MHGQTIWLVTLSLVRVLAVMILTVVVNIGLFISSKEALWDTLLTCWNQGSELMCLEAGFAE
jgi:hypothetical protein